MTTPFARLAWRLGLAAALVLAAASTSSADSNQASAAVTPVQSGPQRIALEPSALQPADPGPTGRPGPYSYRWPVKPFGKQHPVRGFFGDPRIANHGESRQFHFGIDISAPDGTPVYATLTGRVSIHPLHPTTIAVVDGSGLEFSYWHVVPVVREGTRAVAYKTVIGHIEAPYAHVHFSERRGGRYLNPLRSGALGPYVDDTTPTVRSVTLASDELVAEAYDETPLAVPRPWHDLPVMPALVRWRVLDSHGRVVVDWTTAVDFRLTIPSASAFDDIWASGTTQNHVRAPGHYRLRLAALADLRSRGHVVEVAVRDTRGNASVRRFPLDLNHS